MNQKINDAIISGSFIESTLETELNWHDPILVLTVLRDLIFYNRNTTFVNFVQKYYDRISSILNHDWCNTLFDTLISTEHPSSIIADYLPVSAVGYKYIIRAAADQKNNALLAHIYPRRGDVLHACCEVGNWNVFELLKLKVPYKRLVDNALYLINTPVFPTLLARLHKLADTHPHLIDTSNIDDTYSNCKNEILRGLFPTLGC